MAKLVLQHTHLDQQLVRGPLHFAAAVNDQVTVRILIIHGQLDDDFGEHTLVQIYQVRIVLGAWLIAAVLWTGTQRKHSSFM